MSYAPRPALRVWAPIAAVILLLLPALWNRFPLLEYDTGGYLARWYEGTLVPARSPVYGLFITAAAPFDFWPALLLQAAVTVWMLALVLRVYRIEPRGPALLALVALLSATTALPWLASELLTDIFAGLAVLAFQILAFHPFRVSARERAGLILLLGFAVATHSATYAVLLALCLAGALACGLTPKLLARRGLARAGLAMAVGAALLIGANYAVARRFAWTPGGYGLAFGRMLQDGIVTRYLNDHCPDSTLKLCPYRNALPRDADTFLWGSPIFNRLGRFAGLDGEMRRIVLGSLAAYPGLQLRDALIAAARQLVSVGTGEGVVTTIWHTYGMIERYTPAALPAMRAARQQHGEVHFRLVNFVHDPIAWTAMALLPFLVLLALRNDGFADLGGLATTIALALLANAAFCGVISNPHDRYGSRLVWIAPLAIALAALRAVALARRRSRNLPGAIGVAPAGAVSRESA